MRPFDVLDSTTEILGNHVLEASAGTGKTFAIQHVCARLLFEKQMQWEEILVVTFTKEACRLLKRRVRATVEAAVHERRGDLLATVDEMQIFTIHGFCYRMLTTWAFEAGLPFSFMDPQDVRPALLKLIKDVYRTSAFEHLYTPVQMRIVFSSGDVDKLSEKVMNYLGKIDESISNPFKDFVEEVRSTKCFDLLSEFSFALEAYKGIKRPEFLEQAERLHVLLETKKDLESGLDAFLDCKQNFLEKIRPDNLKVRAQTKGCENLQRIAPVFSSFIQKSKDPQLLFFLCVQHCQKQLEKKGLGTFDTLLTTMRAAVRKQPFAEKLRGRYRAVIIDEFQDTDSIQWEIFSTLFLGHVEAFYVVGDPKQSIYSFRSADVYAYMRAKQEIETLHGGRVWALSTNYRSDPGVVQLLGSLFRKACDWMPLPALEKGLEVVDVSSGVFVEERKEGLPSPIHFFISVQEDPENDFFYFIGNEILKWDKSAVLVKDRYQAKRLQVALEKRGICAVLNRPGSLLYSNAWYSMHELLEAVLDPYDMRKVRSAAAGPALMCPVEDVSSLFLVWHKDLKERGFAFFYRRFVEKFPQEGEFQQLADLLMTGETLASLERLDPDDSRLQILFPENGSAVRILTIHTSKGLEFPVVFALGLASRCLDQEEEKLAEEMRLLYVALTRGKHQVYIPYPLKGKGDSPIEMFYGHISKERCFEPLSEIGIGYTFIPKMTEKLVFSERESSVEDILEFSFFSENIFVRTDPRFLFSFSSLAEKTVSTKPVSVDDLEIPAGPETGIVIHRLLEKILMKKLDPKKIIAEEIQGTHLSMHGEVIEGLVDKIMDTKLDGFCVRDIMPHKLLTEMEFFFPVEGGMMKGVIDLFFERDGKYYLLDWKTNVLEGYTKEYADIVMQEKQYFLQAKIYMQAIRRYLRIFEKRSFEECFGGMFYVFVRGPFVYHIQH